MNSLDKVEHSEKLFKWEDAEKIYLNRLFSLEEQENTYYDLGIIQERLKKYDNAISSYTLATFKGRVNSSSIYYRLGYLYNKLSLYKEACSSFLLMQKKILIIKKNKNDKENRILLKEYIQTLDLKEINNWKKVGAKSELLNVWNIAEYAYKNYIDMVDEFESDMYFKLGYVLVKQGKYEEATYYFKEQKIIQSLDTLAISNYNEYAHRFLIEDNIILYDNTFQNSDLIYNFFLKLNDNVYFDTYKHIWVVEDKESIDNKLKKNNIIFITRESDLHHRYLARAKYCYLSNDTLKYFKLKEGQVLLDIVNNTCLDEYIKATFFITIDSYTLKNYDKNYISLYDKREKEIMSLWENKKQAIEDNLIYFHHKFDAENFAGVTHLLNHAMTYSIHNSSKWALLNEAFLTVLEDVKMTEYSLWTSLKGESFIKKIVLLSNSFDSELESELLPYQVWFLFANLFIFSRSYKKYYLARSKARDSILSVEQIPNNPFARYKINALLEANKEEEYRMLREKLLENDSLYIQKYLQLLGISEYYFLQVAYKQDFYEKFLTIKEKEFAEYIKKKSIAIVGPIESGLNVGKEIDSYDVVIRFNYNGLENFDKEGFGSKTDISFYISEILIKDKFDSKKVDYMNELDWVILDSKHNEDDICFLGVSTNMRPRYKAGHAFATTMLKGAPSGIQRVLMDLLRFDIGKIKVFNTNLFLQNNYAKAYKSKGKLGVDYFNFFWHDPLSNFIFLQRLKKNQVIDTDEILSQILEMDEGEYIDALETRYGYTYEEVEDYG